jgi:tetratricopeptide (TPR) repeat protein
MDKYEYRIKADQIRKLVNEENYISAMKIADTIDWRRVKNVSMLCTVSDIYEKNSKYEESHELLLMAYDRSPIGRMMVYKLAELAIKMEDYDEAIDYYREFVHLSPGDLAADILKYKIYRAKGASAEELIPIMEAFKEKEYHEEWAYELAHLYHEAGMGSKCVEECDELILWFSEGRFVEKAMELKMLYRPLSPEQQEKYEHRNDVVNESIEYFDEDEEEDQAEALSDIEKSKVVVMTEDMFSDAVDADDIQIKPINVGKFDTINLQAELAKSMEQIMSATEKEAVDSTMENIRRMVEDSQILDIKFDDELEKNEIKPEALQVEVPVQMEVKNAPLQEKVSFDKVLAEENDGQISLYMPEANILEKQITGQMRIEDVLNEWEKMKSAAQVAIKEAEQRRLNEVKSKALEKAEHIMSKLSMIISEEEMKANGQEIVAALEASFMEDEAMSLVAASLEKVAANSAPVDNARNDKEMIAKQPTSAMNEPVNYAEMELELIDLDDGLDEIEDYDNMDASSNSSPMNTADEVEFDEIDINKGELESDEINEVEQEATIGEDIDLEEIVANSDDIESDKTIINSEDIDLDETVTNSDDIELDKIATNGEEAESVQIIINNDEVLLDEATIDTNIQKDKIKQQYTAEMVASEILAEMEAKNNAIALEAEDDSAAKAIEDRITANLTEDLEAIIANELEDNGKEDEEEPKDPEVYSGGLTKEQQELFSAFLSVRGVEKSLCKIFEPINIANNNDQPFEINHIVVIGNEQTGKTTLAMAIAKAIQIAQRKKSGKVAKITGSSLNSKNIKQLTEKMDGGVLIIEKAGDLTEKTIKSLMEDIREAKDDILLILEDTKTGIDSTLNKDKDFTSQFKGRVELPEYNNDELVEFGKEYAKTLMYAIDDMAILAFYTCLGNIQKDDVAITIEQVREIIDAAINHSNKKKFKKLKDIIMSRRYDEDKRVILQECDFEGII